MDNCSCPRCGSDSCRVGVYPRDGFYYECPECGFIAITDECLHDDSQVRSVSLAGSFGGV